MYASIVISVLILHLLKIAVGHFGVMPTVLSSVNSVLLFHVVVRSNDASSCASIGLVVVCIINSLKCVQLMIRLAWILEA